MLRPRAALPGSEASGFGIASPTASNAVACASAATANHAAAAPGSSLCTVLRESEPVVLERQRADALAGRGKDRVAHGGRDRGLAGLADAAPETAARREHRLDLRHLAQAHHPVVVEVRLLDASVADGDLTPEHRGQHEYRAALKLCPDVVRVHGVARVDAEHETANVHLAVLVDRKLGDRAGVAAVTLGLGDAAEYAGRQGRSPASGFGRDLEDAEIPGRLLQQRAAILERVLAGGVRQLVHEGLPHERILRMADSAPEADRNVGVALRILNLHVRNAVRNVVEGSHRL